MNVFNRIVIVVLILTAMILIPLGLILPEQAEIALRYTADVIAANMTWLNSLAPSAQIGVRLVLAAVGLIVFMIGLLFLGLEIVRIRKRTVRLKNGSGELLLDGVAGHLNYHIDLLAGVLRVRPQVERRGKGVRSTLYIETAPDVNVPAKSAEVVETARSVIEDKLGLEVSGEIKVIIQPAPYPKGRPVSRPAVAARPARAAPTSRPQGVPVSVPPAPAIEDREDGPLHESDFVVPPVAESAVDVDDSDQVIEVKGPLS